MKRYLVAAMLFVSALAYCRAEDTAASLQDQVDSARHRKNLGIALTAAGGAVLVATYAYYLSDLVYISESEDTYNTDSSVSATLTWAGVSLTGFALGICGMAIGIPTIISGAIRQHRAQNALDAVDGGRSDMSFSPVLAYRPKSKGFVLGLNLRY